MKFADSHAHLFLDNYQEDRDIVIKNAFDNQVEYVFLPNIDRESMPSLLELSSRYPENCFPMVGLHPSSVDENYEQEIAHIFSFMKNTKFYAIGETGIDMYWDTNFEKQQKKAFAFHIEQALEHDLPIVIHCRNAFDEVFEVLDSYKDCLPKGVFHCFSGTIEHAQKVVDMGFLLGIGGVVTFKKNSLAEVVDHFDMKHFLLETDAPFLAPTPYRGKRNESAYIPIIAEKIADIKKISLEEVASISLENTVQLFKINTDQK